MRRRVKITGIGPVTPAGIGREAFFRGINESVSRVGTITRFDLAAGPFVGAEIKNFDLSRYASDENPRRLSRHTQFALVAAILALRDAGLTLEEAGQFNPVIVTGTSSMDLDKISRSVEAVSRKGMRHAMSSMIYDSPVTNVPGKIAEYVNKHGGTSRMFAVQTACCSGLDAIGQAAELVANGQADLGIAGGSEAPLSFHPLAEFNAAELNPVCNDQPEKSCRPFDLWRSTGVIGEGAAIFILEPESSPRPPLAWVTGYGNHNDIDYSAGSGIAEAVQQALANACRRPDEVDYISAWGPGHRSIDANEAFALKRAFGAKLAEIPAVSIKGSIGTALGATGAIQVASTVLSLVHGVIPPTVNWETPDPDCRLNLSARARHLDVQIAVIDAHGLPRSNAALILEKTCPR